MSDPSEKKTEHILKTSLEKKLLFMLFVVAIFPIGILLATAATGMYQVQAIIATVVIQVVGSTLGYFFIGGIVRQSGSINEALVRLNNGDFEARAEMITSDELGAAAIAINAMCDNTLNLIQSNDERDRIQVSIENLKSEMSAIAAGDLTITTEVTDDMTGDIAQSVNQMTEQLRSIVRQVQSAAEQVTTSAAKIRESSTTISNDSDIQATCISDASEQLLAITSSFHDVAAMTKESVEVAVEARQTASNGLKAVSDTVDGMQRIRDQVQSTSKRIKRLGESSQEIGEIVQLISDIADRTSILALNASIQAAMAGDAGQGFAVVAEEIECLSERSTDATKQISKLIRAIQNETSEVITDMEESTREVVAGSQLAAQAGETLFEIDSVSNQLVDLIHASSASALQQADTAAGVANSMAEISRSTKDSAEKSREATRSVGQLAGMVNQLRGSVSQFKVSNTPDMLNFEQPQVSSQSAELTTPVDLESNSSSSVQEIELDQINRARKAAGLPAIAKSPAMPSAKPKTRKALPTATTKTVDLDQSEPATKISETDLLRQLRAAKGLDERGKYVGKKQVSPNPSAKRSEIPPTMVVGENSRVAESIVETEQAIDENLLRQLRAANALQNETKTVPDRLEPVSREPIRTIMLDKK